MLSLANTLAITNWCFNFLAILIFLMIIIIGIRRRRELRDIALLLTYNTCFAALLATLAVAVMTSSNLSNGFLAFNLIFCSIWGLFYDLVQCIIYHSYYLQAFYRLCRVVFYKKRSLLSKSLFLMLIISQWLILILILLPPILFNWYAHLPTESYCLVPYTNLLAECYHIFIIYMIPLICIAVIYIWITTFIRRSSQTATIRLAATQRQRNIRDLTVIRRIILLISVLFILRFPTIILTIYAVLNHDAYQYTYSIVGLITSLCMIFIGLMMIHITPQLRNNLFIYSIFRDNRVATGEGLQPRAMMLSTSTKHHLPAVQQQQQQTSSIQRQTVIQV